MPASESVDFLRNSPSRRRRKRAAPQDERKRSFSINNTARAEEASRQRSRLEALFSHFPTVWKAGTVLPEQAGTYAGDQLRRLDAGMKNGVRIGFRAGYG